MLDLKFIRAHPDVVKAGAKKKRMECDVDAILALDEERRSIGVKVDELRGAQKEIKNISDALRALPRLDRRQRTYSSSECPCIHVLRGVCRRPLSSKRRMKRF